MSRKKDVYTQLCEYAARHNIIIREDCPNSVVGMSVKLPNCRYVACIAPDISEPYTRVEVLAHEIGHCMTGAFYEPFDKQLSRKKAEELANLWAISYIMPPARIEMAFERGIHSISGLAKYFDVSPKFIKKAFLEYVNGHCQKFMNNYFEAILDLDISTAQEGEKEE